MDADAATDETIYWNLVMPRHYGGGGVTATVIWAASTATTGTARWEGAFERHDTAHDLDGDGFAATQSAGGTAPGTSGFLAYTALAFTNGAQMDSVAAGEHFRFMLRRDADGTTGTDDMVGDSECFAVELREA